jgi:hypothetical protein
MNRPKLLFVKTSRARKVRRAGAGDYRVYDLKLVRTTDSRILFPFDGAPAIGPFEVAPDASAAARFKGAEIVPADLANPE